MPPHVHYCPVSTSEIQHLYQRFSQLDTTKKGFVSANDLSKFSDTNPLTDRICKVLTATNGHIDFQQIIVLLSIFNSPLPTMIDRKIEFLFRIYDSDNDGKISEQDMVSIFAILSNGMNTEDELKYIVKVFMSEYDSDKDNKLTEADFKKLFAHCSTEGQITHS